MIHACNALDRDESIGCLVITGSRKAFAAGADISEMAQRKFQDCYKMVRLWPFFSFTLTQLKTLRWSQKFYSSHYFIVILPFNYFDFSLENFLPIAKNMFAQWGEFMDGWHPSTTPNYPHFLFTDVYPGVDLSLLKVISARLANLS